MKKQLRLIKENFTMVVIIDFLDGKREKFPHVRDFRNNPTFYFFEWWDEESKLVWKVDVQKRGVKTLTSHESNPSQSTGSSGSKGCTGLDPMNPNPR